MRTVSVGVIALTVAITAAGCGGASDQKAEAPTIVAGFYPLAWVAEQLAGPRTHVVNLTPAGAEPHDLELSPSDVRKVSDADLVVYVGGGFQPALEDAVAQREGPSLDVLRPGESDPHIWLDPVRFSQVIHDLGGPSVVQPPLASSNKRLPRSTCATGARSAAVRAPRS